ncbi:MAG: hypothetical protein QW689_08210, partial [Nitrososphaerota archaeon]
GPKAQSCGTWVSNMGMLMKYVIAVILCRKAVSTNVDRVKGIKRSKERYMLTSSVRQTLKSTGVMLVALDAVRS